jgi:hypothetical protein
MRGRHGPRDGRGIPSGMVELAPRPAPRAGPAPPCFNGGQLLCNLCVASLYLYSVFCGYSIYQTTGYRMASWSATLSTRRPDTGWHPGAARHEPADPWALLCDVTTCVATCSRLKNELDVSERERFPNAEQTLKHCDATPSPSPLSPPRAPAPAQTGATPPP